MVGKDAEYKQQLTLDNDGGVKEADRLESANEKQEEEAHLGEKREAPIELDAANDDEHDSKKRNGGSTANKRQKKQKQDPAPTSRTTRSRNKQPPPAGQDPVLKQEAADKQGLKDADDIDDKAEEAKAKGRDLKKAAKEKEDNDEGDDNQGIAHPSRGTLEKGHIYFWYKPKGGCARVQWEDRELTECPCRGSSRDGRPALNRRYQQDAHPPSTTVRLLIFRNTKVPIHNLR